jgi:hypothetical protein
MKSPISVVVNTFDTLPFDLGQIFFVLARHEPMFFQSGWYKTSLPVVLVCVSTLDYLGHRNSSQRVSGRSVDDRDGIACSQGSLSTV